MPTPIKKSEIKFIDKQTTLIEGDGGKALRNALIQKHALTIAELVQGNTIVRPEEISIDDEGRVIIDNEEFQSALITRIESTAMNYSKTGDGENNPHFFDTNCSCHRDK